MKKLFSNKRICEILSASVWALAARIISAALAVITSVIIVRVYGTEMMGIIAMIQSFLGLTTIFTILGANNAVLRLIPEHISKYSFTSAFKVYRKTQILVVITSIIIGFIIFFISDLIAGKIFSKPHLSFFFILSSFGLVLISISNLNTQALRALRLTRAFPLMLLLPSAVNLLILVIFSYFRFNPYDPMYAILASFMITAIVGEYIINSEFKNKIRRNEREFDIPFKDILSISIPMLISSFMTYLIGHIGVIILGVFRSTPEVGYYAIAVKMATLTTFILSAMNSMAAPNFSDLYNRGRIDELLYVAKNSTKLIFYSTVPILIILIFLGKHILSILYGDDFKVAYGPMSILVIGQFVNSISGSTGYFMNMTDNHTAFRNIICWGGIIAVMLNFALIPLFGMYGAALAGMISIIFWNIKTLIFINEKYGALIAYLPALNK